MAKFSFACTRNFLNQWCYHYFFLSILAGFTSTLFAQSLPADFNISQIQAGYRVSVGILFSPDGRQFFVWDKSGRVFVSTWNGTAYVRQSIPVINLSEEVGDWGDGGFLSVCLDPNFTSNGLVYFFYVVDRHHLLYNGTPQYNSGANEYDNASISRVTRYQLTNTGGSLSATPGSRKVLIGETITTGIPMVYPSHVGGTLLFGRDGTLLVSTGDAAMYDGADIGSNGFTYYQAAVNDGIMRPAENVGALRSQLVNSLCGKVLRIDPATGDGVPSNPFFDAGNARSPYSRVWAMGFRNPYRMTTQPNTGSTNPADANPGTIVVGDVGHSTYEEINIIDQAGLNFGWPLFEGMGTSNSYYGRNIQNQDEPGHPTFESLCVQPTSPTIDPDKTRRRFTHARPALDWDHNAPVARVPAFNGTTPISQTIGTPDAPAGVSFQGRAAIGGAFYTGTSFPSAYQNSYFFADYDQNWIRNLTLTNNGITEVRTFAANGFAPGIVDLEVNPLDGSLFCVSVDGQIKRISYGATNLPPTARPQADVLSGLSPLRVSFTNTSSDPEDRPLTYQWDFGDGTSSSEANPVHVFSSTDERSFTTTLTVTDQGGLSHAAPLTISLNSAPPTATITSPADGTRYPLDKASLFTLAASVTGDNLTYQWQVALLHNNHEHPEAVLTQVSPQIHISPVGCSGTDTYSYRINLKVTNRSGLSATASVRLYPDCGSANVAVQSLTASALPNAVGLSWQSPPVAYDEVLVVARSGASFQQSPVGTTYTADANYLGSGSAFEGGKVVYRGVGQEVRVENLTASTPYYFRVFTRVGSSWNGGVEITATPTSSPTPPANQAPVVAQAVGPQSATVGQPFSLAVPAGTFTDPEGQPLTYAMGSLPPGLSFSGSTLSGTPTTAGQSTITLTATDAGGLQASTSFVITVNPAPTTTASSCTTFGPACSGNTQELSTVTINVAQAGNYPLTISYRANERSVDGLVRINGVAQTLRFNYSTAFTTVSIPSVALRAGQNTIGLSTGSGGGYVCFNSICTGTTTTTPPPANQAPVVAQPISAQSATAGQSFSLGIPAGTFTDPEGQPLTYTMSGLPSGLSFSGSTLSGTPTTAGQSTITLTATDAGGLQASTSFVITITAPAPTTTASSCTTFGPACSGNTQELSTVTINVAQAGNYPLTISYRANERNVDGLVRINGVAQTLRFNYSTAFTTVTIPSVALRAGQNTIGLSTGSGGGYVCFNSICTGTTTTTPPPNQPPVVAQPISAKSATVGQPFSLAIPAGTFTDPEGQPLTYAMSSLPPGLSFSGSTLSGTPTTAGQSTITLTATDAGGLQASTSFVITITAPAPTTTASSCTTFGPACSGNTQELSTVTINLTQAGNYPLTISYRANERNVDGLVRINGVAQTLRFNYSTAFTTVTIPSVALRAGQNTIGLSTGSGGGYVCFNSICTGTTTTTPPPNQAPVVAQPISAKTATVGQPFSLAIPAGTFTDPEGQPLTYAMGSLPPGLSFSGSTLSGTPTTAGQSTITLTATDAGSLQATTSFGITVSPAPTTPAPANQPPVVAQPISAQSATAGQPFSLAIPAGTFTDPEGQPLTYAMSGLPPGLSFSGSTLSGTPTTAGQSTITITATDAGSLQATTSFGITITPPTSTTTVPSTGALALLAPLYNCSTGAITFQTTGGNGTTIEFKSSGITGWTSNPNQYLDREARTAGDTPPFTFYAQQSGQVVTYTWSRQAYCSSGGRIGTQETQSLLSVQVLGNPIYSGTATVEIRGGTAQRLLLRLIDTRGNTLSETILPQAQAVERQLIKLSGPSGLYLLQVSSPTQSQTVKLIRQ